MWNGEEWGDRNLDYLNTELLSTNLMEMDKGYFLMAWIESHEEVWEHHKIIRLCTAVHQPDYAVVGRLISLWHFVLRNAWRDANLEPWGDDGIERASRWDGEKGAWVAALRECALLDGFTIHGWQKRAGRLVEDRRRNELRKNRRSTGGKAAVKRTHIGGKSVATVPYPTVPNHTLPNQVTKTCAAPAALEQAFERFWTAYPKRRSKGDALKAWMALKPSEEQVSRILAAIDRAKRSTDWVKDGGQFIPYPGTWIRAQGWEDEIATGGSRGPNSPSSALDRLLDRESGHNSAPKTDFKVPSLLGGMDKA